MAAIVSRPQCIKNYDNYHNKSKRTTPYAYFTNTLYICLDEPEKHDMYSSI